MLALRFKTRDLPLSSSMTKSTLAVSFLASKRLRTDPDLKEDPIIRFKTSRMTSWTGPGPIFLGNPAKRVRLRKLAE